MSTSTTSSNPVERLGDGLAGYVERYFPSPFLFAILLTYIVYVAAIVIQGTGVAETVMFWYEGFWLFLAFSMQMVVILMSGFVLAYHPKVNAILVRLTEIPNDGKQAVALVGFVVMMVGWVQWGLGVIVGAIFAKEMGKRMHEKDINVHYPVLCLAGYMSAGLTWHWGLSGSSTLLIATPGNEFIAEGYLDSVVPVTETIFSTYGITLTVLSLIFATMVLYIMAPRGDSARGITEYVPEEDLYDTEADGGETVDEDAGSGGQDNPVFAERLNNSKVLGGLIALSGLGASAYTFGTAGLGALDLNVVNFTFIMAGLALYTSPATYQARFSDASRAAAPIILLFPFFAGIQGIMNFSGLSDTIAQALFEISTPLTFPAIAWITSGIVNLFVPSGGGQWIVMGGPVIEAAQAHNLPVGQATMAYAVGDAHTNLLNPFWAIPLLAITRISAREMFGYAIAMMLILTPFLAIVLTFVPYATIW